MLLTAIDILQFKKDFAPGGEPLTLRVEMQNNESLGVRRGRFTMNQEEMRSKIFEPIVRDVIGLVKDQIALARNTVSAVLLVGGFGQSKYLKTRIQAAISSSIQVLQPANGWTAVVEGAAMIGISRASAALSRVDIVARTARRHYGTELITSFDPTFDDSSQK